MIYLRTYFFIMLFLLSGCSENKGKDVEESPVLPIQAIEKFTITETEAGKSRWILEASSAQIFENQKKILLESPVIKFFEKGKYVSKLTAENGRVNTENYDLWGEGKCNLDTVKGEKLETTNLYYKSLENKIYTKDKVKLIRPNEVIYGEGLEASPDLENILIKKQKVEIK